jgi:hypothetical protein
MVQRGTTIEASYRRRSAMEQHFRFLLGAALLVVLGTPLWFDGGMGPERAIAQGLERLIVPTATAAAIVPVTKTRAVVVNPDQFDAGRLLMAGTMLFGLASVIRKAI